MRAQLLSIFIFSIIYFFALACGGGRTYSPTPIQNLETRSYRPAVGTNDAYVETRTRTGSDNNMSITVTGNQNYLYVDRDSFPSGVKNNFPSYNYYRIKYEDGEWESTYYYDENLLLAYTQSESGIINQSNVIVESVGVSSNITTGQKFIVLTSKDTFDDSGGGYLYTTESNLIYEIGYYEDILIGTDILNTYYMTISGTISNNSSGNYLPMTIVYKINYEVETNKIVKATYQSFYSHKGFDYQISTSRELR